MAEKKEAFGGKKAAPFGKGGKQEKKEPAKKTAAKKASR